MPLTRDFKETVKTRAEKDSAFREALLSEALDCFLAGNTDTGKAMLRDYINATIGFEKLSDLTIQAAEEPHADAWPERESAGPEPVRGDWPPAESGRPSFRAFPEALTPS